jgi:superfamily II DNA or RNA helicase
MTQPLWPHQELALRDLAEAVENGQRRICITSPTGGGKTRILAEELQLHATASVYTDRRMLLDQLAGVLEDHGIYYGCRAAEREYQAEKGQEHRYIQLCMVQTESQRSSNGRQVHRSQRVYIDELHKNGGETMQRLLAAHREQVPDLVTIGFTATPLGVGHMADWLIIAGTNSELRQQKILVPALHKAPDEPDLKWIGPVCVDQGECGIKLDKRMEYSMRVYGSVVEHYRAFNPSQRPTILFAPGVSESLWMAQQLCQQGIPAAHIDGQAIWDEQGTRDSTVAERLYLAERHKQGTIKVVCNRFVLREGIDWPWVEVGIFATVFGSLTSYLQAGGRLLRAAPGKVRCTIIDHGGNWWRHGSLNSDRHWHLDYDDRIIQGLRQARIRNKQEPEPLVCPKCLTARSRGTSCPICGYRARQRTRNILQRNGKLKTVTGDIFRPRRTMIASKAIEKEWIARVRAIQKSTKESVQSMTFAQLEAAFARDHYWQYPPRNLPLMPVREIDWFRRIQDVTKLSGTGIDVRKANQYD